MNENLEKKFEKKEAVKVQPKPLTFQERLSENSGIKLRDFYTSTAYDPEYRINNTQWDFFQSGLCYKTVLEKVQWLTDCEGSFVEVPFFDYSDLNKVSEQPNVFDFQNRFIKMNPDFYADTLLIPKGFITSCSSEIDLKKLMLENFLKALYLKLEKTLMDQFKRELDVIEIGKNDLTYEKLISLSKQIESYDLKAFQYVVNEQLLNTLRTTKKSTNTSYIVEKGLLDNYPVKSSINLAQNEFIIGDFSRIIIAKFKNIFNDVLINPYKHSSEGIINYTFQFVGDIKMIDKKAFRRIVISDSSDSSNSSNNSI